MPSKIWRVDPVACAHLRDKRGAMLEARPGGRVFDVARALQTAENIARLQDSRVQAGEEETMLSAMKFKVILWGMAQLLAYAAWRHPPQDDLELHR